MVARTEGTPVVVTIATPVKKGSRKLGKQHDVKLTRRQIDIPVAQGKLYKRNGRKVGVVQLASFTETDLREPAQIEAATKAYLDLIADLRRINSHVCSVAYPILEAAGARPACPWRRELGGRIAAFLNSNGIRDVDGALIIDGTAELITQTEAAVRLRGVMGYEGHLMIVDDRAVQRAKVERAIEILLGAHEHVGGEIVSSGGTEAGAQQP